MDISSWAAHGSSFRSEELWDVSCQGQLLPNPLPSLGNTAVRSRLPGLGGRGSGQSEGLPQHHRQSPQPYREPGASGQPCCLCRSGGVLSPPGSVFSPHLHAQHMALTRHCSLPMARAGERDTATSSSGETLCLLVAEFKGFSSHPFGYFTGDSCSTVHIDE